MTGETFSVGGDPPSAGTAPTFVAAPLVVNPLRLKSLTICDFRAFPGPEPVVIALDGKNLLVYGENGSGKSSVFHALDEFFSTSQRDALTRKERLKTLGNAFSGLSDQCFIEVELDDGGPAARWNHERHPVDTDPTPSDPRIVNAARRKAMLDYRSLLDTNYRHGEDAVNLFDVCVRVLLRDYPALYNGREVQLSELWRDLEQSLDINPLRTSDRDVIDAKAKSLNAALAEALEALTPKVNAILTDLGWADISLKALTMPGVQFVWDRSRKERHYAGRVVSPQLFFREKELDSPQNFLNEARLSALALSIYFAGRQVCAATLQSETPRLMVLDDVLIGLDQSNRLPVLKALDMHFADWQIVLLTHDRVWFEMARSHFEERGDWAALEMFEERRPDGGPLSVVGSVTPSLKQGPVNSVEGNLATARKYYAAHEYPAAAVHARIAFELSLKKLCDKRAIPVRFQSDPRKLSTEDLLNGIEPWLQEPKRNAEKAAMEPPIANIRMLRKIVINQFAHSTPVNIAANEVKDAIDAVESLHAAIKPFLKAKP
jgi:energy-coupling factor transporter ATP-binding protein EcfA2